MRWIVTGSNGFIGQSVTDHLLLKGHQVSRLTRKFLPRIGELIRSYRPDCILHAAGSASVQKSWDDIGGDFRDSVSLWEHVLESVRMSDLRPTIFFPSSASVFGEPLKLPMSETDPFNPISPYGWHKLLCENLAREYARLFDMNIVVCRLFSVFGPEQKRLLIWELFNQLMHSETKDVTLKGTGLEERDYLYISDVAEAIHKLSMTDTHGLMEFNFGSGESVKVIDIAHKLQKLTGKAKNIIPAAEAESGNPRIWLADNAKLRSSIQWLPSPFEDSLSDCVSAWQ